jgi:hypothetical protein
VSLGKSQKTSRTVVGGHGQGKGTGGNSLTAKRVHRDSLIRLRAVVEKNSIKSCRQGYSRILNGLRGRPVGSGARAGGFCRVSYLNSTSGVVRAGDFAGRAIGRGGSVHRRRSEIKRRLDGVLRSTGTNNRGAEGHLPQHEVYFETGTYGLSVGQNKLLFLLVLTSFVFGYFCCALLNLRLLSKHRNGS